MSVLLIVVSIAAGLSLSVMLALFLGRVIHLRDTQRPTPPKRREGGGDEH